jgi:hypothetical protein
MIPMMREAVALALGLLMSAAIDAEAYVCIAESKVGLVLDKTTGTWREANFKATGKYVISRSSRKKIA